MHIFLTKLVVMDMGGGGNTVQMFEGESRLKKM